EDHKPFFTPAVIMSGIAGLIVSIGIQAILWSTAGGYDIDESFARATGLSLAALAFGAVMWSIVHQDSDSQASLAFSIVLHGALLFSVYYVFEPEDEFTWPGPRALAADYPVARLLEPPPPPPEPKVMAS